VRREGDISISEYPSYVLRRPEGPPDIHDTKLYHFLNRSIPFQEEKYDDVMAIESK